MKTIQNTIEGLIQIENTSRNELLEELLSLTDEEYHHDLVYGRYCTIHEYINCPPEQVFEYLSNIENLQEWTYSIRNLRESDNDTQLYQGYDAISKKTKIYCKVKSNRDALTVDYHCAWDQPDQLWMVYLNRIIPAQSVLNKPGSVVIWTNCKHPYYDQNPFHDKAPPGRDEWVGDFWVYFPAGHIIEMKNLKKILEHRHSK